MTRHSRLSIEFVSNGYLQNSQLHFRPPRIFLPHVNRLLQRWIVKLCTPCNHDIIIWAFLMQFQHYMFLQHKECVELLGHLKTNKTSVSRISSQQPSSYTISYAPLLWKNFLFLTADRSYGLPRPPIPKVVRLVSRLFQSQTLREDMHN
jgi:hypothetical protein